MKRPKPTQEETPPPPPSLVRGISRPEAIAKIVNLMAEAWCRTVSPLTIQAYYIVTYDLDAAAIETAYFRAISEYKRMPSPAEFRELSGVLTVQVRAESAWVIVRRSIPREGSYVSVDFDDPIVNATVRALGGWPSLCDTRCGDPLEVWMRKRFVEMYVMLANKGVTVEEAAPLIGLDAVTKHASGHGHLTIPPRRIDTGLPPHTRNLILAARPKVISQAIVGLANNIGGTD